ncbi:MAG: hypothetical protein II722_09895, partial [Ruminococcus sp.]|nr:hypothetical protein [Ruminococcus sp.]
ESCYACDLNKKTKLTDEQTEKLLAIVRKIKLKNDSRASDNSYLGIVEFFEIDLKSGKSLYIPIMPQEDDFIMGSYVYCAIDNKFIELEKLYYTIQK